MKKFIFLLLAILISIGAILPVRQSAFAASEVDQQYTAGGGSVPIDAYLGRFAQTFMPTKTRLDKVQIELTNVVGSKSVNVSIRHFVVGSGWDEGNVATVPTQTITNGWNTFDFEDITTTVSDTETYGIWVVSNADGPQWKYTSGPSTYARGYAIWQNQDKVDWDYNFKSYGYDPETPAGDTPPTGTDVTGNTTTTAGDAPATTTSSSIEKPTNLKAEYSSETNKKGDKLTWTASKTTAIDGYKVFRSEAKGKSYVKIGQTAKSTVEYLDATAVAGKTYYYVVRAYKTSAESASSNEASVAVPADAGPSTPTGLKITSYTDTTISISWTKNPETDISGYELATYIGDKQDKLATVKSDKIEYTFSGLNPDSTYKITLIAKNSGQKTSNPVEISQKTRSALEGYNKKFEMTLLTWILSGVGVALILALIVLLYIRKKKIKKTKPPVIN